MFYLDNAATTPVLSAVLEKSLPYLNEHFGNPSSLHHLGVGAARAVKTAREALANMFHLSKENVIFCSSGTEANHLALWGIAHSSRLKGNHIIASSIEHPSVLRTLEALQTRDYHTSLIRVLPTGVIDIAHLETLISEETRLVSCMAVNNEIGTKQPLEEIGTMLKKKYPHIIFHVDAVQAFTKIPLLMKSGKIDLLSISGHKIGAPKGIAALIFADNISFSPVILGGGQEHGMRSGTENVFGIVALAEAAFLKEQKRESVFESLIHYKQQWLEFLSSECAQIEVFHSPAVLPYFLSVAFPPIPAEVFLHHLEAEGIYVSSGSACSSKKTQISHVSQAIGMSPYIAKSMIRLSFSAKNSLEDQHDMFRRFSKAVGQLKELI
ncbi:MAG: cysteine desulfurase [SAR324 cluster bacterium]|nr:cysteine desulfurase [SAR324 cluster bacterium]